MLHFFSKSFRKPPFAAIFLSGSGTNAEALLKDWKASGTPDWTPSVLITDRPETSRARELAARFHLPLIEHDIAAFYHAHGLPRVTILSAAGMKIRELWTQALRAKLAAYSVDFGILAGFVPLSNIVCDFPCLNVHPGDLTRTENGVRIFAGLYLLPIETAILRGEKQVRSSVILAQQVSAGAAEMDEGPVLGVSDFMDLDLRGHSAAEFAAAQAARKGKLRKEYSSDLLSRVAEYNVDRLKVAGDWKLFPRVVRDFALGCFAMDEKTLVYDGLPVRTVEYHEGKAPAPVRL